MNTAWALLVVSSEGQAEALPHQRAWAQSLCRERGWHLARIFEGVSSGKDGPRRLVRDLLAALRSAEPALRPEWLVMIRLDRLGREALECQFVLRDIRDLGVRVWTRDGGEERGDSAMTKFVSAAKLYVAEHENDVRRDKARNTIKRKRAAGLPVGRVPYGLERTPDGHYAAREPQAEAVRVAFQRALGGAGARSIGKHLIAIAPPVVFASKEQRVRWDPARTRRLLRTRAYIGTIVDEVTFERVQRTQAIPPPLPTKYAWPLNGVLRCYCGRNMVGQRTGTKGRYPYYVCRATWKHGGRLRHVRAEPIEGQFVAMLAELAAHPDRIGEYRDRFEGPSVALIDRALREARRRLDDLAKARQAVFDLHAKRLLRDEDVQERLDDLARRRDEIAAEVADLERERAGAASIAAEDADTAGILKEAAGLWDAATDDERRAIARGAAMQLGGLCAEPDGALTLRYPDDPDAQLRRRRRNAV